MDHLYVGIKHLLISLNVTGYMEISMDSFGREFLNKSQYYQIHGNIHGYFKLKHF